MNPCEDKIRDGDVLPSYMSPDSPLCVEDAHAGIFEKKQAQAIAFSEKTDDGLNPNLWEQAELVIIGLSGQGKTPISKHLSRKGFKVANFPLVRNCAIPEELFQIEQHRVVGLTIRPDVLLAIRRERCYQWGVSLTRADFTDYDEIEDEVKWAKRFYRQNPDWKIVNTTDKDPTQVAEQLAEWLKAGLPSR